MSERFVLDTNVLVSSLLLARSVPQQAHALALARGRLLFTPDTLGELREVVGRPKFDRYVPLANRMAFVAAVERDSDLVPVKEVIRICRDPRDDIFLGAAVSGAADCLVSGDAHRLELHPFRTIPILTPASYLEAFAQTRP